MSERRIISKRFIAGAVCPACEMIDRIVVETAPDPASGEELSRRRCVACGFVEEFQAVTAAGSGAIPRGRPERPRVSSTPVTPVRIVDPDRKG